MKILTSYAEHIRGKIHANIEAALAKRGWELGDPERTNEEINGLVQELRVKNAPLWDILSAHGYGRHDIPPPKVNR